MDLHRVFLVLADISGYTRFIKSHKTSLLHAEHIITQLMESVIDSSENPLQLNKLEGDAVLLYAESDGTPKAAQDILGQVRRFFEAFYGRQSQLEEFNICHCAGCMQIGQLDLKAILHCGEVAIKQVRQFEELAGTDVILAHRLLKNSIGKKEYILMTEPFFTLSGGLPGEVVEQRTENCEGIGRVSVRVQYPQHQIVPAAIAALPGVIWWRKMAQFVPMQAYTFLRMAGMLKGPQMDLPAA